MFNRLLPPFIILIIVLLSVSAFPVQSAPPPQAGQCSIFFANIADEIAWGNNILEGWMTSITAENLQGRVSYGVITFDTQLVTRNGHRGYVGRGRKFLNDRSTRIDGVTYLFNPRATDNIEVFVSPGMVQVILLDWGNFTHQFSPTCQDELLFGFGQSGRDTSNRERLIIHIRTTYFG